MKKLHHNAVHKQNKTLVKEKEKEQSNVLLGEIAPKPIIMETWDPNSPKLEQWILAFKTHSFHFLDVTKPIDCQMLEKLTDVKETLTKQFDYNQPSMNFEHMRVIADKILKT